MTVEANAIGGTKIIADTGKDAATGEPVIMGSALAASINGVAAGVTAITATVMRGHPGARRGIRFGNRGAVWEAQRARNLGSSTNRGALVRLITGHPTEGSEPVTKVIVTHGSCEVPDHVSESCFAWQT